MDTLAQNIALIFAGMALGWTAMFSFVAAPQAFRELDRGRANRFVRNAMKGGHPAAATLAGLGALAAFLAQSIGGAAVLALAAAMYLLARWTLLPREDEKPVGARRRIKTAQVVAAALTATIMAALLAAVGLVALGV